MISRTVLVTGGAGFVGSHLAERLLARGDAVTVLDDFSTGRRTNLAAVAGHPRLQVTEGSVTDAPLVARLAARADEVVHLAAVVGVRRVLAEPARTSEVNVRGTESVLAACAARRLPVLVASSSEVYGRQSRPPFREDAPLVPAHGPRSRWVYAASKLAGEEAALALHRTRGLPVRIVRLFNTSGPRQVGDFGMVLPRFVGQALAGAPLTVHGDGRQTRSFTHVEDTVEAIVRLLACDAAVGCAVNVGTPGEVTVRDLAERVVAAAGTRAPIVHVAFTDALGPGFEEPGRRSPDVSLLRSITGFAPARTLDEIIADAVRWARASRVAA